MKPTFVFTWTFATLLSAHLLAGQNTFQREDQQSLDDFLKTCYPSEDGFVNLPASSVSVLKWGNPSAGEKIVYLYASPGKDVVSGDYAYYEDGPLLLMVMEHEKGDDYLEFVSEVEAPEIVLGSYPRTVAIDSMTTSDLNADGIEECIVRFLGAQRCEVELEEENPETGEIVFYTSTATCDHYGYAILRQERKSSKWLPAFSVEWIEPSVEVDDTGNFLSFPDLISFLK